MDNLEKYRLCFCQALSLKPDFDGSITEMGNTPDWDSVGHMELITEIENTFDITFDAEDILRFISYSEGMELLVKYGIKMWDV